MADVDIELFREAVKDAKPLKQKRVLHPTPKPRPKPDQRMGRMRCSAINMGMYATKARGQML